MVFISHVGKMINLAIFFFSTNIVVFSGGGNETSQAFRPTSQSGRPMSGVSRPGTMAGRPPTMGAALATPRTARTARPVSATSGRFVRLGES